MKCKRRLREEAGEIELEFRIRNRKRNWESGGRAGYRWQRVGGVCRDGTEKGRDRGSERKRDRGEEEERGGEQATGRMTNKVSEIDTRTGFLISGRAFCLH